MYNRKLKRKRKRGRRNQTFIDVVFSGIGVNSFKELVVKCTSS